MRLTRRNSLFLVYVKAKGLKYPIVVPIPLAAAEELLKAVVAVVWMFTGGMKGKKASSVRMAKWAAISHPWHLQKLPEPLQAVFPGKMEIQPWRIAAAAREFVAKVRHIGPFDLVDVETPEARVLIKLV